MVTRVLMGHLVKDIKQTAQIQDENLSNFKQGWALFKSYNPHHHRMQSLALFLLVWMMFCWVNTVFISHFLTKGIPVNNFRGITVISSLCGLRKQLFFFQGHLRRGLTGFGPTGWGNVTTRTSAHVGAWAETISTAVAAYGWRRIRGQADIKHRTCVSTDSCADKVWAIQVKVTTIHVKLL